jgi:hypothetical protein
MFKPPEVKTQTLSLPPGEARNEHGGKIGVKIWRKAPSIDEPVG